MTHEAISTEEVGRLVREDLSDARLEELAQAAHSLTLRRFGRTIGLYAPIYLSNSCINSCRYCGFNRRSRITRTTLTPDEAAIEAEHLIDKGHRQLLLVAGEDPHAVPVEYIERVAAKLKGRVAKLLIETQPFDEASYARLFDAGIDGVTLYQETYHRETYERMHPAGPKSDFESRLAAIEAAGRAGMRFLGIGALLGLHDWRIETLALVQHARRLQKEFWQSHVSISFPRIRDCNSDFAMPSPVSDRELTQMIVVLRLALPDAGLVLSTREPASLRDRLLPLGITQMSAGSVTSPGGYTKRSEAGEQFHIEDTRSPDAVARMLKQAGYDPVWKDWERI